MLFRSRPRSQRRRSRPHDDTTLDPVETDGLLAALHEVADAVGEALATVTDWGPSGRRDDQYAADLVADEAALGALSRLAPSVGWGVLSEESGIVDPERDLVVVVDPLDGSTNASRGIAHFATSLCVMDADGPLVSVVAHQAIERRWWAVRGGGAFRNGRRLDRAVAADWGRAVVAVSGRPPLDADWWQYRTLGAGAIDLCLVADGSVDAFIDMSPSAHGIWD